MKKETGIDWVELEYGVHLNICWLRFGLKILCSNENYYHYAGENFFKVNHKTTLYKYNIQREINKKDKHSSILKLTQSSSDDLNEFKMHGGTLESTLATFAMLNEFSQKNSGSLLVRLFSDEIFFFESIEKKEVFIPLLLENNKETVTPLYLSLALNELEDNRYFKEKFNGFNCFVTAGCLFGASLQAVDKKGATFPIIQHKIAFTEGEQIIEINPPNKELHPYEIAQFNYLKEAVLLMKKMANKDIPVEVVYHLPNFDYILSGIKLFIHNKISYEALLELYIAVKERSQKHITIIKDIFKNSELILLLESPFMNLLKDFFESDYDIFYITCLSEFEKIIAEENKIYVTVKDGYLIYKILSPIAKQEEGSTHIAYTEQIFPPKNTSELTKQLLAFITNKGHGRGMNAFLFYLDIPIQKTRFIHHKKMEQAVVKKILEALCNNGFAPKYAAVWKDILKIDSDRDKIRDIESLFKMANAMVIAKAAKNTEDDSVCSFLPFNENPIFRKYKMCREQWATLGVLYPKVFSLTRLEDLIFYSRTSPGNVFYFQPSASKLTSILNQDILTNYKKTISSFNLRMESID